MHIAIHLGNQLMAEAVYQLLMTNGYDGVVVSGRPAANGVAPPDVLLVDTTTLRQDLDSQYPGAKVLLMDTDTEPAKLCDTFLSYRIHGVLSSRTELSRLKKALAAVSEGKLWIDDGAIKTLLHDAGVISNKGKVSHITSREQEIIQYICLGLSNNEIARRLGLSLHTVKSHLNRIFRKLNVTNRSRLVALATHRAREVSV